LSETIKVPAKEMLYSRINSRTACRKKKSDFAWKKVLWTVRSYMNNEL